MIYPPNVTPFPDVPTAEITLGAQHRALLTLMAQRPGHVVTPEQAAAKLGLPSLTPRRAGDLVRDINAVLGTEAVIPVERRGWKLAWDAMPLAS